MIKNLFRITVLGFIWKRYKIVIVSTIALFIYFWLVGMLHEDFVSYSDLNDDKQYVGLSFIIKWFAFVAGFIVYIALNSRHLNREVKPKNNSSVLSERLEGVSYGGKPSEHEDPFDAIRKKGKLRSKADFIIEKNKNNIDE